ncbi:MAG: UDP-3-O-acyl-N-acetylglucosamine deacetylase, partial [Candidatus Aerophobetes bacterium]|nr:UDP-3-O-acyl-N-acetylglucosamine deacetylase [Candidatus Aerophobetes bacterium]
MELQRTIKDAVSFKGIGLHVGKEVTIILESARPNSGIVFIREDLPGFPKIRARVDKVISNRRGTSIGNGEVKIYTVEHILAALSGLRIDNVIIKMDGEEVPAADGSALPFVELIKKAQIEPQKAPRNLFKVEKSLWLKEGDKRVMVFPNDTLKITYVVDFPHSPLKTQFAEFTIDEDTFIREIAPSRTFGFMEEVEELREKGLIQGGSLDNAVVIDKNGVLNKKGL